MIYEDLYAPERLQWLAEVNDCVAEHVRRLAAGEDMGAVLTDLAQRIMQLYVGKALDRFRTPEHFDDFDGAMATAILFFRNQFYSLFTPTQKRVLDRALRAEVLRWRAKVLRGLSDVPAKSDVAIERAPQIRKPSTSKQAETVSGGSDIRPRPQFQNRASWLKERLRERAWNKHDLSRQRGPDHKTVQKILDGFRVREDVLQRVADVLSKKHRTVTVTDIPQD